MILSNIAPNIWPVLAVGGEKGRMALSLPRFYPAKSHQCQLYHRLRHGKFSDGSRSCLAFPLRFLPLPADPSSSTMISAKIPRMPLKRRKRDDKVETPDAPLHLHWVCLAVHLEKGSIRQAGQARMDEILQARESPMRQSLTLTLLPPQQLVPSASFHGIVVCGWWWWWLLLAEVMPPTTSCMTPLHENALPIGSRTMAHLRDLRLTKYVPVCSDRV